jgi:hypothetical protein
MNATINYINAVEQHITAGKTLREALELLMPTFNKAKPIEQQKIRLEVAKVIGKESGCKPIVTKQGNVSFDRKTKQGDAARKMLNYYLPNKPKRTAQAVVKQVDVVSSLLKKFKALSPAEKRRFLNSL